MSTGKKGGEHRIIENQQTSLSFCFFCFIFSHPKKKKTNSHTKERGIFLNTNAPFVQHIQRGPPKKSSVDQHELSSVEW